VCRSLGRCRLLVPTPDGDKTVDAHVEEANIPFLIGLDTIDAHGWNVLTVENQIHSKREGWYMPLERKLGHIFLTWDPSYHTRYTRHQLQNMHLHFMHPSNRKLFNLLERAYPEKLTTETWKLFEDIKDSCHACQRYTSRPISFKVRFPDEVVFNKELRLDIMTINGKAILHVVDSGTNFSAARFLAGQDTKTIWNTFLYMWVTMYTGYPSSILTDQGSVFTGKEWIDLCAKASVSLRTTGTESHNSLGQGETYQKVAMTHAELPDELSLALSVKAMNDTAGPHGLVPSLLLFGVLPRFPEIDGQLPDQDTRLKSMALAREEYEKLISQSRISSSMRKKAPPAANYRFVPQQPVYVYREKQKHWTGPHLVVSADEKAVYVDLNERTGPRSFNLAQVKPAKLPAISELISLGHYDSAGLSTNAPLNPSHIHAIQPQTENPRISFTEVISPRDPRSGQFDEASREEGRTSRTIPAWNVQVGTKI
jgi:hypothetical protein